VIELVKKPTPAGELFDVSAVAVRKLEHLASTLGTMVDVIREITTRPLTASQRALAIEAFERLNALDPWAQALDHTLHRLRIFADNLDR
jgi:hypothetical protein